MKKKFIILRNRNREKKIELSKYCPIDFFNHSLLPFSSNESIIFLNDLSELLLNKKNIKELPELMALAFWIRKANLTLLIKNWKNKLYHNEVVRPRGVAFHITPSNVDSIFIYSFALSLLCGNSNLIRITNKPSKQIDILLDTINILFKKHSKIGLRNKIFTYEHDEEISNYFSINSDLRIIWGGDTSINLIKKLETKPNVKDISFSDKSSLSIINNANYLKLNEAEKIEIARAFYNDSYWFNQMACSSPKRVIFIGKNSSKTSQVFWKHLGEQIVKHSNQDDQSLSIRKLNYLYSGILNNTNLKPLITGYSNMPTVLLQEKKMKIDINCGGGFFIEVRLSNLSDLSLVIDSKDQTISYFGFNKNFIKKFFLEKNISHIDRIVPIGNALDFSPIWDGYDIFSEFTKILTIS